MFGLPEAQNLHLPQNGSGLAMKWSPGLVRVTPGPTFSTIPAPSCPRIMGNGIGRSACIMLRSVWQTPLAT